MSQKKHNNSMKKLFYCIFLFIFTLCLYSPKSFKQNYSHAKTKPTPMMAIVIDDFGSYDQSGVETLLNSNIPLTCAVLPNVDNTDDNIKQITNNNHELILHMPMESHVNLPSDWYGPIFIKCSDTPEIAIKKIEDCFSKFPNMKGFNIHIGSGVSQNKNLMSAIYNYANQKGLYFLDSRTIETEATTKACMETNSIYLGRDVFLEPHKNRTYAGVKARLLEGANLALEKGYAIVIGHVGAEGGENTAKAIVDTIPEIEKMEIKIVPLSEIYDKLKKENTIS